MPRNNTFFKKKNLYPLIFFLYSIPLIIFSYVLYLDISHLYKQDFNDSLVSFARDIDEAIDVSSVLQHSLSEEIESKERKTFPFSLKKAYVLIRNSEMRPLAYNGSQDIPNIIKKITNKEFIQLKEKGTGSYSIHKVEHDSKGYYQINFYSKDKNKKDYLIQILVPSTYITKENREIVNKLFFWVPTLLIVTFLITYLLIRLFLSPIKKINDDMANANNEGFNLSIPINDSIPLPLRKFLENVQTLISRERDAIKGQEIFIAHASHQLKTPLTIIKGNTESLLRDKKNKSKEDKDSLEEILNSINDLKTMIEKLTVFSSLEKDIQAHDSDEGAYIIDTFMNVLDSYAPLIKRKQIDINFTTELENDIIVKKDPKLIRILIDNLLQNAIKYSSNDKEITIDIKTSKKTGTRIEIFNYTENQIAQEDFNNLKKPFYRPPNSRSTDGTGLGLSIADRISQILDIDFSLQMSPLGVLTIIQIKKS